MTDPTPDDTRAKLDDWNAAIEAAIKEIGDRWKALSNERTDSALTSYERNEKGPGVVFATQVLATLFRRHSPAAPAGREEVAEQIVTEWMIEADAHHGGIAEWCAKDGLPSLRVKIATIPPRADAAEVMRLAEAFAAKAAEQGCTWTSSVNDARAAIAAALSGEPPQHPDPRAGQEEPQPGQQVSGLDSQQRQDQEDDEFHQ